MQNVLQNSIFDNPPPDLTYDDLLDSGISIAKFAKAAGIKNAADWKKKGIPAKFQPVIRSIIETKQKKTEVTQAIYSLSKSEGGYTNTTLSSWNTDFYGLVKTFSTPTIGNKDGSYFIRCFGTKRNNTDTSDKAYVLILDGDSHIDEDGVIVNGAPKPALVHEILKRLGIQHLIYSSYSNDIDLSKYRMIMPCEYSPEQLPILLDYLFKVLHEAGVMLAPVPENRTWSQPWYFPRVPDEQHKDLFEFYQHDGALLDVEAIYQQWLSLQPEPQQLKSLNAPPINFHNDIEGQRDPIKEFNQAFSISVILIRNGYIKKGQRYLRPDSKSKIPAVQYCGSCADGVERVYSHGSDTLNDGYAHDAFDCYRLLECGGDWSKALAWNLELTQHNQRLYRQEQAKNVPQPTLQEQQHTEPEVQNIIDSTLAKLDEDIAAWYTTEFIQALYDVYLNNQQEYKRIYHKLKKWKIALEVDKEIKVFSKKSVSSKNPTLPALPTLSGYSEDLILHQSNTETALKPIIKSGELISYNDDGKASLVIESEGAVILSTSLQGSVAYSLQAKTWHLFTGTHWQVCDDGQIDKVLINLLYLGTAGIGFRNAYRNNIKALIADGGFLPLPAMQHDLLLFKNGLLDYKLKILYPITPDNAQTWCLPYNYDAKADCPNIKAWLLKAVNNDAETVEFLRAWLAALLHGRADLQKFLHLIGSGGTGKGTFIRLTTVLVGELNAVSTTLKEMETNRFEPARYYGARLVKITDSDKYGGSVNTLKAMTGQDHIRIERKHQQQSGDFIFGGLVIMASNENLTTTDHTSGLDQRRLTVYFDRRATDEEKQAWQALGGEEVVLHSEIAGLVNWLLELSQDDIS